MMLRMAEVKQKPRFTESLPGRMAGWLLAALWIYSMSGIDSHSFSAYPACVLMLVVLLLAGVGILAGYRLVRMSWLGWFTLAAAGYFLIRCVNSYAVTDSYEDEAIILGGIVYYVAGVYVAQNQRYSSLFFILGLALVLNIAAFWATKQPWFCLGWTGRAPETPEGCNHIPTSLFIYKNFAGFFFVAGGFVLGGWALWAQKGWWRCICVLLAVVSIVLSFYCETRVPYFMLPLAMVVLWVFDVVLQLYSGKKLGGTSYIVAFVFLTLVLAGMYDLFLGNTIGTLFSNADSHLRYHIWGAVCEVFPHAPLWGCGAGATEWEIIPHYAEWHLPNYAHNDYLQVWLDYGLIGISLALMLIGGHLVRAFFCMSSEWADGQRKKLVAVAWLMVCLLAAYACADFPWHSYALVSMGAFSCGIMASPFARERGGFLRASVWSPGSKHSLLPIQAQKRPGRICLFLILCGLVCFCYSLGGKLRAAWIGQWEYNAIARAGQDTDYTARRAHIASLLPLYPAPALMDTYYQAPLYQKNFGEQERLLRIALGANPKQMFTMVMLADVLDRQCEFEESEKLMRSSYVGDAMQANMLAAWPSYYAHHLLLWGRSEMQQQRYERAVSLLGYALAMHQKRQICFNLQFRGTQQTWLKDRTMDKYLVPLIRNATMDLKLLRKIGVQPDDSWQEPLEPGGRPSLYRSWVKKADK